MAGAAPDGGTPARIVDAEAGDAAAVAALLTASITALCAADHGNDPARIARWTANKTPQTVRDWIADPEQRLLAGWEGDALVSVGAFAIDGIRLNYVAPGHTRRGHGTAMLTVMEACLGFAGVTTAHLTATRTALGFYRAKGYREDGPAIEDALGWGQPMTKDLTQ